MASVALEDVSKTYDGDVPAVRGVSLAVADGEFVVLVGPSGCGKSTLLRMIAGLETPTAGTVRIGDRVVNDVPPKDRDVAMVFQNYALYPHMTVRKNLSFGLRLRGTPRAEAAARVDVAAAMLGIGDLLDRRPGQLSGGQRQRVALGRAIVRDPAVFLFDEPLSNLDAQLRGEMRRELAALHRRLGTTSVYVTHDQTEAMTLGDRVVVLHQGEIQQTGAPLELYDRPANRFVAGFLGSPPMNLIDGTLTTEDVETVFRWGDHAVPIPPQLVPSLPPAGAAITLGVRPEDLRPADGAAGPRSVPPAVFRGPIDEVQPLGGESLIHFNASGAAMTAKVPSQTAWQRGHRATFTADPARLQWFAADGRRIA